MVISTPYYGLRRREKITTVIEQYWKSSDDDRQRAVIGLAVVSTERRHVDSMLNEIISFAEQNTAAELVCSHIEII
ncbi:MAG: DUF503 family protein [Thermincola sp.]|nr:DUF503 family protein [Thermincola sp.]